MAVSYLNLRLTNVVLFFARIHVIAEGMVKWITDIIPEARDLGKVLGILEKYVTNVASNSTSGINVIIGPVYDYVTDGVRDSPDDLKKFWDVGR